MIPTPRCGSPSPARRRRRPPRGRKTPVASQVNAVLLLELLAHPVDDLLVPVIATQMVIAIGGEHLHDPVREVEDGNIERAATQVKHQDLLLAVLLVKTVGKHLLR